LGNNHGIYAIIDQRLWLEPSGEKDSTQGLGAFARIAGSPEDRSINPLYVDGGFQYQGLLPGRDQDLTGVAVAWIDISDDLGELARDFNEIKGDYEVTLELTHHWAAASWWTVQPSLQYIIHPGGSPALGNAFLVGVRTSIVF
jgi:porin